MAQNELYGNLEGTIHFGIQGPRGEPGPPGKDGKNPVRGKDYWTEDDKEEIVNDVLASEEVSQIQQEIAKLKEDINYKPIDITSISDNVGTVEKGVAVTELKVTWALNKDPVEQVIGDATRGYESLDVNVREKTVSMDGRTSVTLIVTDERGATDSASAGYNAYNGVYYGVLDDGTVIDNAAILSLNKKIQNTKGVTFTADCTGGKRIAYAIPSTGYGTPTFQDVDTKLPIDMTPVTDPIQFTNAHGYTTEYKVWLSTHVLKLPFTVAVS